MAKNKKKATDGTCIISPSLWEYFEISMTVATSLNYVEKELRRSIDKIVLLCILS
jgi:hypothetical protein